MSEFSFGPISSWFRIVLIPSIPDNNAFEKMMHMQHQNDKFEERVLTGFVNHIYFKILMIIVCI